MSHARLAPSNHRWPKCPGSVREEAGYPDTSGAAAHDGTGSHLLLELCLNQEVDADFFLGQEIENEAGDSWVVEQDRVERVQKGLDFVRQSSERFANEFGTDGLQIDVEQHADAGKVCGRDDWNGTADVAVKFAQSGLLKHVHVIDYKDGQGWVGAKDNSQLLSYAIGVCASYISSKGKIIAPTEPFTVTMSIVQPKTYPWHRSHTINSDELIAEAKRLSIAAELTDDEDAPLVPGDHCQWCKANPKRGGHCTAMVDNQLAEIDMDLVEVIQSGQLDVKRLESDKLAQLLDMKKAIEDVFGEVEAEVEQRLELGDTVGMYGFGEGRASKVWNETDEEIAKKLKNKRLKQDDIYPKKLISPAQCLKLDSLSDAQKKKIEEELISVKAGKRKLVKKKEKDAKSMFDSIPETPKAVEPVTFL